MNEYLKAADDAKRLLAGFKAVATVADAFEKVGQLQQAGGEAQATLTQARGELIAAKTELDSAKAKAQETRTNADELMRKTESHVAMLKDEATKEAAAVVASAKEQAKATRDQLQMDCDAANQAVSDAQAKRDALNAEVNLLENKLDTLKAQAAKLLT